MQIENLTDEELIKSYHSFKTQSGIYSVQEQALKVLINSLKCMGRGLVTAH